MTTATTTTTKTRFVALCRVLGVHADLRSHCALEAAAFLSFLVADVDGESGSLSSYLSRFTTRLPAVRILSLSLNVAISSDDILFIL